MFNDLLSELTKNILEHGGKKLILPDEFCERVSIKGNHKLNSWLWAVSYTHLTLPTTPYV